MKIRFERDRYKKIAEDFELWWEHKLERPIIQVTLNPAAKMEGDFFATDYRRNILNAMYDMEMPPEKVAEMVDEAFAPLSYYGDAFPGFYMRPTGVLGGYLGQDFGIDHEQGTVWFKKTGQDLEGIAGIRLDPENPLLKRSLAITEAVQNYFDGLLGVGYPDLGGVFDIVASIRDSNELLLELYEDEDGVKEAAWNIHEQFKKAYDLFDQLIDPARIPGYTCWATMLSRKPYFVLQNDFSAMISSEMYDDFYLPILQKECRYIPRTIYHLDGPGAVRHLDSILTIEELDGVQWINGAGAPGLDQWPDIYKKIIGAGKLCQVFINGSKELHYIDDIVEITGTTKGHCFICTGVENEKEEFDRYLTKYHVL